MKKQLRGLYAITDRALCQSAGLGVQAEAAIQGGARLIQYRDKGDDPARRLAEAEHLLAVCRAHGVPLIINDDLELARRIGADGLHLGRDDGPLEQAREALGPAAIIGVSCYNDPRRAREAQSAGADYAAFGRFFPSATKPGAVRADVDLLRRARRELHIPIVAIGGITPENGARLVQAGADMLAVIQGVFAQPDIRRACRTFANLFEDPQT
ncbi:MAG TPA: thiamine phosphate synthase [Sedimenticola sp.]|nr:thiamine phosphate synthase [Sedimenticola sp.]